MEMVLLGFQMLLSGMKGVRREMFDALIKQVRELVEDLKESRDRLEDRLERAYNTQETILKQVDDLQRQLDEASMVNAEALKKLDKTPYVNPNTYQLYVRSGIVKHAKIPIIKALRHVTNLGLKEAKDMVDTFTTSEEFTWICLSREATQTGLEAALTTLLINGKLVYNPDCDESDVKVYLNV